MSAIDKQHYELEELPDADHTALQFIYEQFFSKNNCPIFLNIFNKTSRIDGVMSSGNSIVVMEYKNRNPAKAATYPSMVLELKKFKKLQTASRLFGDCPMLYICELADCILIYHLKPNEFYYEWKTESLPSMYHSKTNYDKVVTFLPVLDADIIIAKRTFKRATRAQLLEWINKTK